MSISSPRDFRYGPAEEVEALAALSDPNVTLYCIDARGGEAVFVECESAAALDDYPFYYQGQFQLARRAVVMPLEVMHAVAERVGDRFRRAVMIHSVGRCGSTLLSRMFGSLRECLSLSEPDVHTQISAARFGGDETIRLLRSAARLYYHPPASAQATHLVLKFRSFCVELARSMEIATPAAVSLFLYRDLERVIRSGMRVFRYAGAPLWWLDFLHRAVVTRPALAVGLWANRALGERLFPVLRRFTTWELSRLGAVGILAIAWVSAMERCVKLQRTGMRLAALRYDDLIGRPGDVAAMLVKYCELPSDCAPRMLAALDGDSQRGSVIERRRQQDYEITPRDRDTIALVLSRSEIIDSGDYEVAGTLRHTTA